MKIITCALLLCLAVFNAHAKWRPLTETELKKYSDTIVVAEFISEISHTKTKMGKTQIVKFKVNKIIKGTPPTSIKVHGSLKPICIAQYFFKNTPGKKFLLFLHSTTKNGIYCVVNGQFGALPISKSKMVNWFTDPKSYSWRRSPKLLTEVVAELTHKEIKKRDVPK